MKFRSNSAVDDGLQITLNGGQRRTEIMGNIGNEIPLVFFHFVDLIRHIVQCCRQISHLIVGRHIDLIGKISRSIFIGACYDFFSGTYTVTANTSRITRDSTKIISADIYTIVSALSLADATLLIGRCTTT